MSGHKVMLQQGMEEVWAGSGEGSKAKPLPRFPTNFS